MNHTCSSDLKSSCLLAELIELWLVRATADIHLKTRLCKRKITRSKSDMYIIIKDRREDLLHDTFEIWYADSLTDDHTLQLPKHGIVTDISVFASIYFAWDDTFKL